MDGSTYRWINRLADRTGWAHGFFRFYAGAGVVVFALLLLAAFLDGRQHDRTLEVSGGVVTGLATMLALGLGQVIGNAVDRLRPYDVMDNVHVLVSRTTDFSFPSDHATMAGAVAVGLLLTNRRWGVPAVIAAVLMAFTRVYVGAHYPGDVLAGLALGGAIAAAAHILLVRRLDRLVRWLTGTPVGIVVAAHPARVRAAA